MPPLCCHIIGAHIQKKSDVTVGPLGQDMGHRQKKCCLVRSLVLILPQNTMAVAGQQAGLCDTDLEKARVASLPFSVFNIFTLSFSVVSQEVYSTM